VDVGLQLVDENGQLAHDESVRTRSEARRHTAILKQIEDASVKDERRHHFSLLKPVD
jgi:hypothetical protein